MQGLPRVYWGTSTYWLDRAHVVVDRRATGGRFELRGLCCIPVTEAVPARPSGKTLCPDCAIALVTAAYPDSGSDGRLPLVRSS